MTDRKDDIYTSDLPGDFQFNSQVAEVFTDMINRSVPCYPAILRNLPLIARRYIQDNSNVYDLGCSLGAVTFALRSALTNSYKKTNVNFIAVDNSQAMIERAQLKLSAYSSDYKTDFILDDITQVNIENASLVVMNFVLQFLKPEQRLTMLQKVYQGLNKGGVFILSEKFSFDDNFLDNEIKELHWEFKKDMGYSELEVQRKRTALENVMIIDSWEFHQQRLREVGFKVIPWQQGFNFGSFLCIKV